MTKQEQHTMRRLEIRCEELERNLDRVMSVNRTMLFENTDLKIRLRTVMGMVEEAKGVLKGKWGEM